MEQLFPRFWLDKYVTRSLGFADLLQFFFTHIYDNAKGKTTSEIIDEYKDRIPQVAEEVERVYPGELYVLSPPPLSYFSLGFCQSSSPGIAVRHMGAVGFAERGCYACIV